MTGKENIHVRGNTAHSIITPAYAIWPNLHAFELSFPKTYGLVHDALMGRIELTLKVSSNPTHVSRWGFIQIKHGDVKCEIGLYDSIVRIRIADYAASNPAACLVYDTDKETISDVLTNGVLRTFPLPLVVSSAFKCRDISMLFNKVNALDITSVINNGRLDLHAKDSIPELFREYLQTVKEG